MIEITVPDEDPVITAFQLVTKTLWDLKDDAARERVLRATAILLGYEFLEEARRRR